MEAVIGISQRRLATWNQPQGIVGKAHSLVSDSGCLLRPNLEQASEFTLILKKFIGAFANRIEV